MPPRIPPRPPTQTSAWTFDRRDAARGSERRRLTRTAAEELVLGYDAGPLATVTWEPLGAWCKRALDVIGAVFGLVLLAPSLLLIAVLIKLTSRGPVVFRQVRVGEGGRLFNIYKFRTMIAAAEAMKPALAAANELAGPVFKIRRDPRVTPLGRVLRKYSLDELPQLWNVLCGDMSLVGPRPPVPQEVVQYRVWQARRLSVKPGLTCLWQVSGRNHVGFSEWMRLDLRYIDRWSLLLDLTLLLQTIRVVIRGDGAY